MANAEYLQGRKKYGRPQALLFANNPGTIEILNSGSEEERSVYVPLGYDLLSNSENVTDFSNYFLVLSDDNRSSINFSTNRIEKRERMINGRMRSYHIADKLSISTNWDMLPSRSAASFPDFNVSGISSLSKDVSYTTDGGAGGVEILDWYENTKGSFWVYLAYDKYNQTGGIDQFANRETNLSSYNQIVEMYFSDFSYSVVKRGGSNFDFWNISFTLEEV